MKPPFFSSVAGIGAWLDSRGMFHMDLGLGRMRAILSALKMSIPAFRIIQVLGTNGKGSTSAFLAALAREHGFRTGLYTSPHFVNPAERILIDGRILPEQLWLDAANGIMAAGKNVGLTYFEFLTTLAMLAFRAANVDIAIIEAGLGGANDATTALPADALCFTPIAMDHAAILGPAIGDIARDKAAAIRGPQPVFSAPQYPVPANILRDACARHAATLAFARPLPPDAPLSLKGSHQRANAALALAAWRQMAPVFGVSVDQDKINMALSRAFLPGRLQKIPVSANLPPIILDGAHNPHGMAALTAQKDLAPGSIVFSCLGDKDWPAVLGLLIRSFPDKPFFIFQLDNERAANALDIAAFCSARDIDVHIHTGSNLDEAIRGAAPGPVLLTGSLYLLAEFFRLHPQYLTNHQTEA